MTREQLIEEARKALEEFDKLPDEEQFRILIAAGTINEKGEVLMGLEEAKRLEREQEEAKRLAQERNGASPQAP